MAMAHMAAFLLLVVGGLNWLLWAVFGWEIGQLFGGMDAMVSKVIYVLVGVAAIFEVATHKANCMACKGMKDKMGGSGAAM